MYLFYVYAYLRHDGSPYYIGKGKNKRYLDKHNVSVPKDKSRIVFLETNLSNVGALALERRYIRWYGRKDIDTGILRNVTDGGEGRCGMLTSSKTRELLSAVNKGRQHTNEARANMSAAKIGKQRTPEVIEKMRNRTHSDETKAKMSASAKNRPKRVMSVETKERMSIAQKKKWKERGSLRTIRC